MMNSGESTYDERWEDPLPHALSPTKHYLSRLRKGITKAIVIFMHGRGDNIDDMVDVFLPILMKRYGGVDGQVKNDGEYDKDAGKECPVAVIGIEARDNVWYPESHNAVESYSVDNNMPYQYSALDKIRRTMVDACEQADVKPKDVIFVGFSQGANLGNTYLLLGMKDLLENGGRSRVPIPGHVLALAGSLFKTTPTFPNRKYESAESEKKAQKQEMAETDRYGKMQQPSRVVNRLLCGTGDQYFPEDEIKEAAAYLGQYSQKVKDHIDVQISVGMEPKAPHMITGRMIAATVEAIDEVLGGIRSDTTEGDSVST